MRNLRPSAAANRCRCLRSLRQTNWTWLARPLWSSMNQLPTCNSCAQVSMSSVTLVPVLGTTSIESASTPSSSSMLAVSSGTSAPPSSAPTKSSRLVRCEAMASICAGEIAAVFDMKASDKVLPMVLICSSCGAPVTPSSSMPWRSRCSSLGNSWITRARSVRLGLALAAHTSSEATRLSITVCSSCPPYLSAARASTSAQTLNRNSRISSRTGMSLSILRSSMVYWIAIVSFCSTCCATLMSFLVASPCVRYLFRKATNSS